jgi:uncharacterized membrane protein YsdA (DUF1294 family)
VNILSAHTSRVHFSFPYTAHTSLRNHRNSFGKIDGLNHCLSLRKVKILSANHLLLFWLGLTNVLAFLLFAWDKFKAGGDGANRISEFNLTAIGAVGGWPGGLLAMLLFRHKTTKLSFQFKYALGFVTWAGLLYAVVVSRRR